MVPLVMSACELASQSDEAVLASLSFQFGKLCSGLSGKIQNHQPRLNPNTTKSQSLDVCLFGFSPRGPRKGLGVKKVMLSLARCVSVSLSEEQKARLLQRFKVLCLAGLQTEGNQTEGNNEATLIRCNCCYNLPVNASAQADPVIRTTGPALWTSSSPMDYSSHSPSILVNLSFLLLHVLCLCMHQITKSKFLVM